MGESEISFFHFLLFQIICLFLRKKLINMKNFDEYYENVLMRYSKTFFTIEHDEYVKIIRNAIKRTKKEYIINGKLQLPSRPKFEFELKHNAIEDLSNASGRR